MTIVVGSAFRNASNYLRRYFAQVTLLRALLPDHQVRVVAVEGDSTDGTPELLRSMGAEVVTCAHGGPVYGSTEEDARMVALSAVGNAIFNSVKPDDDVLVYIESDLLWDPQTVRTLIQHAIDRTSGFDVFAPLVFAGSHFYDVWAFRKDGARFSPLPPYHAGLNGCPEVEIDSAGSCLVMRTEVARSCRIRNNYCLVGWCEDARAHGFRIAAVPGLKIHHPA